MSQGPRALDSDPVASDIKGVKGGVSLISQIRPGEAVGLAEWSRVLISGEGRRLFACSASRYPAKPGIRSRSCSRHTRGVLWAGLGSGGFSV